MHANTFGRNEGWLSAQAAMQPLDRLLAPEDVARLMMFLLSDTSLPMTSVLINQEQWVIGGKS